MLKIWPSQEVRVFRKKVKKFDKNPFFLYNVGVNNASLKYFTERN
jgi:hypothetical protein